MVRPSNKKVDMLTGSIPHCLDSLVNPLPLEIPYSLTPLLSVVSKNSMNYVIIQCNLFNVRGLEGPNFLQGFESRIFSPYYFLLYLIVCSHCPTPIKMGRTELCGGVYTTQRTTQILTGFCVNFLAYVFVSVLQNFLTFSSQRRDEKCRSIIGCLLHISKLYINYCYDASIRKRLLSQRFAAR